MDAALPSISSHLSGGDSTQAFDATTKKVIENFYDQYAPALYGKIKTSLHKEDICREVLKATFLKIHQSFDQLNFAKDRPFTWAYKIACKAISNRKIDIVLHQVLHSINKQGRC